MLLAAGGAPRGEDATDSRARTGLPGRGGERRWGGKMNGQLLWCLGLKTDGKLPRPRSVPSACLPAYAVEAAG